jgi:hypothetical protein
MAIKCNNCGALIIDDYARFCDKCGTPTILSVSDDSQEIPSFNDKKISFNEIETLPKRKIISQKRIQETRCTCLACGKIWYYGKSEVLDDFGAKTRNLGKNISGFSCCCWPMYYMPREKTSLNQCPNCASKAIKKEQVIHEVE